MWTPFRVVVSSWIGALGIAATGVPASTAAGLPPLATDTLSGWARYVAATERRMSRELADGRRFLARDFDAEGPGHRAAIAGGAVLVDPVAAVDDRGGEIDVAAALVHHWRGAVLIPGIRLPDLLRRLQDGPPGRQEDVLAARVLSRGPDRMQLFLRLQRSKFVTVVYNTEHAITFRRHGAVRASSTSLATAIAEVENPGAPTERELPPGDDRGFLWRWHAYWRYEETPGGVIAECESLSLSRPVPFVLRYLAGPLIRSTARESMDRTLVALRDGARR